VKKQKTTKLQVEEIDDLLDRHATMDNIDILMFEKKKEKKEEKKQQL